MFNSTITLIIISFFLMTGLAFSAGQTSTTTGTTGTSTTTGKSTSSPATTLPGTKNTTTGINGNKTTLGVNKSDTNKSDTLNKTATTETVSPFISDSTITAKVKTELLASKNISSLSISVATDKGIVTLSGTVESLPQKEEVVKITSHVSGVKSVIDQLTVNRI